MSWNPVEAGNAERAAQDRAMAEGERAAAALAEVNRAMEDLRRQLEAISALVGRAMAARSAGYGLVEMFVRAQEFTELTMQEAERGAAQILASAEQRAREMSYKAIEEAERGAAQIIGRACEAAEEVLEQARRQAMELAGRMNQYLVLSPEALKGLETSIDRFTRANNEVKRELSFLHN